MASWLRSTNWFQRIALVLVAVAAVLLVYLRARGEDGTSPLILAVLISLLAFGKQILWRVRNRLLITYFLFGVVPIVLISAFSVLVLRLSLGQLAADRVKRALDARIGEVQAAARDIDQTPPIVSSYLRKRLFARMPRLGVVIEFNGETLAAPPGGPFRTSPAWVEPGFQGLIQVGDSLYIAARRSAVFTFLPLTLEELDAITGQAINVPDIATGDDDSNFQPDSKGPGGHAHLEGRQTRCPAAPEAAARVLGHRCRRRPALERTL